LFAGIAGAQAPRSQEPAAAPPAIAPRPAARVFRGEPLEVWIARLDDLDPDVQNVAAFAVGRFGAQARAAIPALLRMLESRDTTRELLPIRANAAAAAEALGEIGLPSNAVVGALAAVARRSNTVSRTGHDTVRAAIRALGQLRSAAAGAVEALVEVLQRPLPENPSPFEDVSPLQREAARALGLIGPPAAAALPALDEVAVNGLDVTLALTAREAASRIRAQPFGDPTQQPFADPAQPPFGDPTQQPFGDPTQQPFDPTRRPAGDPTKQPFVDPTRQPFVDPIQPPNEQGEGGGEGEGGREADERRGRRDRDRGER
jgi:hypothetical protein